MSFLRRKHYSRDLNEDKEQATQAKLGEWPCKGPAVGVGLMQSKPSKAASENGEQ